MSIEAIVGAVLIAAAAVNFFFIIRGCIATPPAREERLAQLREMEREQW